MRLLPPLFLLALGPALASCMAAEAQEREPGGEPADPATADARLDHRFALEDWSAADLSYVGGEEGFKNSRAICARYLDLEPPAADWPLLGRVDELAGCDSFNLANHIGGPPDYERARHCALREREEMGRELADNGYSSRPVLEGPGLLAVLYANGQGVERNLPVAIHMACEMNGAPFEMEARIMRLEEMRRSGWQGGDFSTCDDMTSGYAIGQCSAYQQRLAEAARHEQIMQASQGWPRATMAALGEARDAFETYARTANQRNCDGGTLAAACATWGTNRAMDLFTDRLLAVAGRQSVPPVEALPEGDLADGGTAARAATASEAEWQAFLAELPAEDRAEYEDHRAQTIAARRAFEPRLVAFLRQVRPDLSAHDVRVLFRDL